MEKLKLIKDILGKGYASGEEHLFHCPYCKHHKRKFSVNIEKNFLSAGFVILADEIYGG